MKAIFAFLICVSMLVAGSNCLAAEDGVTTGQITDSLDGKFKMLIGDRAFTNLGSRMGIIKGDVFMLYANADTIKADPVGKCAVVQVYDTRSVCEIIEMNREIGKETVTVKKIAYDDALLYPSIFTLLSKVVEPYEPSKKIKVYIYQIFDENHNVTEFSQKIRKEMAKVFFQKKRMVSAGKLISPALTAYLPGEYNEYNSAIEDYLKKDDIDVIISGTYKIIGDKVHISYYKIDRNFEDIVVDTFVPTQPYAAQAAKVVTPFREQKKEQIVKCTIIYKPVQYKTLSRDERNDIVTTETRGNAILEYMLRRSEFNIIGPVEFTVVVDGNPIKFDKLQEFAIPLATGEHTMTASYSKGFYFNDTFLVALPESNRVKKTATILIDKPEDITVEIQANPLPRRENITFNVYRASTRSSTVIKPVLRKEISKPVEVFKD